MLNMVTANGYTGALELNWINKDMSLYYEYDENGKPKKPEWVNKNDIRVSEPRILKLVGEYGDTSKLDNPLDNALIRGDNLLALKTLVEMLKDKSEKDKIKCVYLDPPYNIDVEVFEYYSDNLEHSQWLTMMKDRLMLIKKILRKDGLIFVHIDDQESAYLKILMDEVFGRENFINTICVVTSTPSGVKTAHKNKTILKQKEYIHVYGNGGIITLNPQYKKRREWDTHFNLYLDHDTLMVQPLLEVLQENNILSKNQSCTVLNMDDPKFKKFYLDNQENIYQTQSFKNAKIKEQSKVMKDKVLKISNKRGETLYYRNGRQLVPLRDTIKNILTYEGRELRYEKDLALLLCDIWDDINFTNMQNEGTVSFPKSKKPEFLIMRILELCTKEGDVVLDSFAGSGTTAAVAHKMNRRWITIEIGKHAETHCIPRFSKMIKGEDQDKKVYGGGFRYYQIGESLINNRDINWSLTYQEIAKAICLNLNYNEPIKINDELYVGEFENNCAFCIVSKEPKILKEEFVYKLLRIHFEGESEAFYNSRIIIYTNNGIAIKDNDLPNNISIEKIPELILTKYNL